MGLLLLLGGAAAGGEDLGTLAVFDGVHQPRPIVLMAVGGETELTPTTYQIGVGPGIGTASIGGTTWLDITHDVDAIAITGPELDEIESTSSGTCTLLVDNTSGDYDPENTTGPYSTTPGGGVFQKTLGLNPDQANAAAVTAQLDHLEAVGAEMVWLVLALEWVSTGSGTWDATAIGKYDEVINQASARNLPIVLQAHGMPTWITTASGHTANTWHGPDTAGERSDWVAALHNFIVRYGAEKFSHVEVWNEPNLDTFWVQGANAADYARLLQATHADIRGTWSSVKVVGHNMSRNDLGWQSAVYTQIDSIFTHATASANSHYHDAVGVHPYCGDSTSGYNPSDTSHTDEGGFGGGGLDPDYLGYRRLRDAVVTHEGVAKPLAFGEFGYTTTPASWFYVPESTRAVYLQEAMELAAADGYVEYLTPFFHDSFGVVGGGFNIHGTTTETAYTAAALAETPVSLVDLDVAIWVRAEWQGGYTTRFLGVLDAIIPDDAPPRPSVTFRCIDGLAQLGRTHLATTAADFDTDRTGSRVNRILDAALWPSSKRAVDPGRSRLGRTTMGASALQLLAKVERTEFGHLYIDYHAGGILTFAERYKTTTATRSTAVQATISDAGGMNALERSKDRERLFNDVHVTRDPNPSEPVTSESLAGPDDEPVEQVASDAASVETFGVLSFPGEAFPLARNDSDALAGAQWLAPRYAIPQTRITKVGVQGVGHNQWTELLGLRLLDRIRVQRTAVAVPLDRQLIIQQLSEDISRIQRSWDFTFATEAPQTPEPATVYKVGLGPGIGTGSIGF